MACGNRPSGGSLRCSVPCLPRRILRQKLWELAVAYAPGVDVGTLKLIPEASRSSAWQLSAGASAAFADAWGAGIANPYTPEGVKALLLQYLVTFTGDGVDDECRFLLRKNGSAVTDAVRLIRCTAFYTTLPTGKTLRNSGLVIVECDIDGIVEYINDTAATVTGTLYLNTMGYYL